MYSQFLKDQQLKEFHLGILEKRLENYAYQELKGFRKVELDVNETKEIKLGRSVVNDIAPREGEIDLVCVFENMWNKKGVYVWAILAFFIVGTMVGLLSSTLKSDKRADTQCVSGPALQLGVCRRR